MDVKTSARSTAEQLCDPTESLGTWSASAAQEAPRADLRSLLLARLKTFSEALATLPSMLPQLLRQAKMVVDIFDASMRWLQTAGSQAAGALLQDNSLIEALLSAALALRTEEPRPTLPEGAALFAVLQAQRAAAELLAALLEDAPEDLRRRGEARLLEAEGGRLIHVLANSPPDPKLHELLCELLWRGLRHVDIDGAEAKETLQLLEETWGLQLMRQLKEVEPQQLLEWGRDMALQKLNKSQRVVVLTRCEVSWGKLRFVASVEFTAFGVEIVSHGPIDKEDSRVPFSAEIPYSFLRSISKCSLRFRCDGPALSAFGRLQEASPAALSDPKATLEFVSVPRMPAEEAMQLFRVFADFHQSSEEAAKPKRQPAVPKAKPKVAPKPELKAESKTKVKAKAKAEPKPKAKAEAKAKAKAKSKPAAKAKPEPKHKAKDKDTTVAPSREPAEGKAAKKRTAHQSFGEDCGVASAKASKASAPRPKSKSVKESRAEPAVKKKPACKR